MAETDFEANGRKESRLSAAKRACQTFIAERPDDLIGLIAFANWPHTICPLTLSHSVLQEMLHDQANPRLAPQSIPNESRTNLGDALAWALHRFSTSQAKRNIIVLISDGEHNVPPPALSPDQAAQLAANQRIPIYVIDVGTANPDSARGRDALVSIAERTGGRYYLATETNSLADAWNAISQLERSTIESFQYRRYWELSHFVGVAALVCCVAIVALQSTVWLRVP
jgi:Ca-activated chloride channel family protein